MEKELILLQKEWKRIQEEKRRRTLPLFLLEKLNEDSNAIQQFANELSEARNMFTSTLLPTIHRKKFISTKI